MLMYVIYYVSLEDMFVEHGNIYMGVYRSRRTFINCWQKRLIFFKNLSKKIKKFDGSKTTKF